MEGATTPPRLRQLPAAGEGPPPVDQVLRVFFDGIWHEVHLYRRARLLDGHVFAGPCVVAQDDTTSCIPPGFTARVDATGNILLTAAE